MKYTQFIILSVALFVVAGLAIAQPVSSWNVANIDERLAKQATKACIFPSGGWTTINCSNAAAASSAQLNAWSRYAIQCGDDSYFAPGTAASGQDADSADGWIPSGAWLEFMTTDTIRYVSVLNKNADSDCRILECK